MEIEFSLTKEEQEMVADCLGKCDSETVKQYLLSKIEGTLTERMTQTIMHMRYSEKKSFVEAFKKEN